MVTPLGIEVAHEFVPLSREAGDFVVVGDRLATMLVHPKPVIEMDAVKLGWANDDSFLAALSRQGELEALDGQNLSS